MIYAYADTEMKRAAIQKADAVRRTKPVPDEIWAGNEAMILKLSGLIWRSDTLLLLFCYNVIKDNEDEHNSW